MGVAWSNYSYMYVSWWGRWWDSAACCVICRTQTCWQSRIRNSRRSSWLPISHASTPPLSAPRRTDCCCVLTWAAPAGDREHHYGCTCMVCAVSIISLFSFSAISGIPFSFPALHTIEGVRSSIRSRRSIGVGGTVDVSALVQNSSTEYATCFLIPCPDVLDTRTRTSTNQRKSPHLDRRFFSLVAEGFVATSFFLSIYVWAPNLSQSRRNPKLIVNGAFFLRVTQSEREKQFIIRNMNHCVYSSILRPDHFQFVLSVRLHAKKKWTLCDGWCMWKCLDTVVKFRVNLGFVYAQNMRGASAGIIAVSCRQSVQLIMLKISTTLEEMPAQVRHGSVCRILSFSQTFRL